LLDNQLEALVIEASTLSPRAEEHLALTEDHLRLFPARLRVLAVGPEEGASSRVRGHVQQYDLAAVEVMVLAADL
jgi:hypothetical protein